MPDCCHIGASLSADIALLAAAAHCEEGFREADMRTLRSFSLVLWRMTLKIVRQSLLSLHMTKSYVRTATRTTLKVEANLTQILNFKANFHTEFEPFFKKKIYANNGRHFKIVSIKIKKIILST